VVFPWMWFTTLVMPLTKLDLVWLFTTWLLIQNNTTAASLLNKKIALRSDFFLHAIGQFDAQEAGGRLDVACHGSTQQ
jgi:hypothetical protein